MFHYHINKPKIFNIVVKKSTYLCLLLVQLYMVFEFIKRINTSLNTEISEEKLESIDDTWSKIKDGQLIGAMINFLSLQGGSVLDQIFKEKVIMFTILICFGSCKILQKIINQDKNDLYIMVNQNLLLLFQARYTAIRLDLSQKGMRGKMIQAFLSTKNDIEAFVNLIDIIPQILIIVFFWYYLQLWLTIGICIIYYIISFVIFTKPTHTSVNHIFNIRTLKSVGKYAAFCNKLNNFYYFLSMSILRYLMYIVYVISIYDIVHHHNKKIIIHIIPYIWCIFFFQPYPTYDNMFELNRGIGVLQYFYQNKEFFTKSSEIDTNNLVCEVDGHRYIIPDGVSIINGASGTGKTTLIGQLVQQMNTSNVFKHSVVLISSNFMYQLPLIDIFRLYSANITTDQILTQVDIFGLSNKLLKYTSVLNEVIHEDDFKWHLCAASLGNAKILICDDINIIRWLDVLKTRFQKIIITYDDYNGIYKKNADLYINLNEK